eukprot:TRINITY_DN600_c0_g1_i4.p1 TRINITY_DN600_c0_g1~~TRINITY_DN600_c0_g1_i4.p1  ORF type:complete len:246 (+),score=48.20 TRINITY_DN600_c0_g1_i4:158-895(+)
MLVMIVRIVCVNLLRLKHTNTTTGTVPLPWTLLLLDPKPNVVFNTTIIPSSYSIVLDSTPLNPQRGVFNSPGVIDLCCMSNYVIEVTITREDVVDWGTGPITGYIDILFDLQACTEMIFPISSNGVQDMFPPAPFNLTSLTEYCVQAWGVTPRANWIPTFFGTHIQEASYIIFTNGDLDPWSSGGQLKTVSNNVVAIFMDNSAHHLDLRLPNVNDPPAVTAGRALIVKLLSQWITEITNNKTNLN